MVNEYLRQIVEGEFTSKDFRTWTGTVQALVAFKEVGEFENKTEAKRKIVEVVDKVSKHLGNTRSVCRKYYVHPTIVELYENNKLLAQLGKLKTGNESDDQIGLANEEKILMEMEELMLAIGFP